MNIKRFDTRVPMPQYAHKGDAGLDLRSVYLVGMSPGQRRVIRTGIGVEIPDGYAGLVCPRSGLARDFGVTVLNAPGVIDSGYRGEILVNLVNLGGESVVIEAGDRIAQLVITTAWRFEMTEVDMLTMSDRGSGGHGSTGRA